MEAPKFGTVGWIDITVPDAEKLREFYEKVAGWSPHPVDMDGYQDYAMMPPGAEQPAAGICHTRGDNAGQPPGWMIYILVPSLDESIASCTKLGGSVVVPERNMGGARFAVIKDPSGAHCALFQPAPAA
jgi:uncharacterized protein